MLGSIRNFHFPEASGSASSKTIWPGTSTASLAFWTSTLNSDFAREGFLVLPSR